MKHKNFLSHITLLGKEKDYELAIIAKIRTNSECLKKANHFVKNGTQSH